MSINANPVEHMIVLGTSAHGKSMLSRLSESEMQEWWEWARDHQDINGMDWPGWAEVRAREAAAMPGDIFQNIEGVVYNDAFQRHNQS